MKNFVERMCAKSIRNRIDSSKDALDFFVKFNSTWAKMQLKLHIDGLEEAISKLPNDGSVNNDKIRSLFEYVKKAALLFLPSGSLYSILLKEIEALRSSVLTEKISLEKEQKHNISSASSTHQLLSGKWVQDVTFF